MRIRARKQLETAKKKGRVSADTFEIDDEVRVQDAGTKRWSKTGRIVERRQSDDGQDVSFVILMANGGETNRHRLPLRHNITRYTKVTDRKLTFNLKEERGGEDKNTKETETKKRGRLSKLDKAESTKDYKTDSDSNDDSNMGIAKRTRSKTTPDSSDIPLKRSLKKRTSKTSGAKAHASQVGLVVKIAEV